MSDTSTSIIVVIIPLFAAGLGYLLKETIERRKILQSEVYKEKRELYQQFINLIVDLFSNSKVGKDLPTNDLLTTLFSFYKKYILYASPEVINAYSDYFQYLYHMGDNQDHKVHFSKLTKVMAVMRDDLGLANTELGKNGERLFRALITDFDEIMYK
jgi:hypothetical protein